MAQNDMTSVSGLNCSSTPLICVEPENLHRLSDDDIVLKAIAEHRIILTHDLDFSRIVALRSGSLPSVVTFRLDDMRAPQVNKHLEQILQRFDAELEQGALVSVQERGIRVRRLPIQRAE